jgi:lipopolysaccharide export system ATP-binding protein
MKEENSRGSLKVKDLVKSYGKRVVVKRVNLEVNRGQVIGLLGPNGAGKTTTFYMIVGLMKAKEGQIFLDGEDITHEPMYIRARQGVNYLSQEPSVFRKLTVEENLLAIMEVIDGGERRRLEITRAMITHPKFILLDEPFAGIDPMAINDIKHIVKGLKKKNLGILISDHNVRETLDVCDLAYIINNGEIIESGVPEKIATSEVVKSVYLGEDFNL